MGTGQSNSATKKSDSFIAELANLVSTGKVYFQPPANVQLEFPCFLFHRNDAYQPHADDINYLYRPAYKVTYINRDEPDPDIIETVLKTFKHCHYTGHSVVDNLHHDYFTIYY